jgi:hypothetical protein
MEILSQIEAEIASNLGENSPPYDINEKIRRLSFLNQGIKKMLGDCRWWFLLEERGAIATSKIILISDDIRDIYRLSLDGLPLKKRRYQCDYGHRTYQVTKGQIELDIQPSVIEKKHLFSLSSEGLKATAETLNHGLMAGDYVLIEGANQPQYLGSHQITNTTADSFSFELKNTASPASGEIYFTKCNLVYKAFINPPPMSRPEDVCPIPDNYVSGLVGFVVSRFSQVRGKRASAQDGLSEFNAAIKDMKNEHMEWSIKNRDYIQ